MSEAIAVINAEEVQREVAPVVSRAEALVVVDVEGHTTGLRLLADVMGAERKVKAAFAEPKRKAHEAHKAITALEASLLVPVLEARQVIMQKCAAFEAEERRIADEKRKELQAEALARQEEQRQLDAAMADTEEEAEEALTAPLAPPPVPEVKPAVAKVAGISARQTWHAEVTDKAALVAWCLLNSQLYLLEPNMVALNSLARNQKEELSIAGVKAVKDLGYVGR